MGCAPVDDDGRQGMTYEIGIGRKWEMVMRTVSLVSRCLVHFYALFGLYECYDGKD